MKQRLIAKVFVILMAVVMLFSICAFTVNAAASNETARNEATQSNEKTKRPTYTETLQEVNRRLPPAKEGFWRDGIRELKEVKSYDDFGATVITQFAKCIEDGEDANWDKAGFEILKGVVNLFASCYGLGGVSNALLDAIGGFDEQSDTAILQTYLGDEFKEVHNHLDEIQSDISDLSTQVDASTKEIIDALNDALEAEYAKDKVITFTSSTEGNFNYKQFKSYLYGSTDAYENPYYYTQAYYNKLVESIVKDNPPSSDEVIKENYDALYRSLASTSGQDEANIVMLYDYLLYDEQSGEYSIQRYYYDYLCANSELLGDRNAEYEALQFTLDLYMTALFAEHCIAMCNNYQLVYMYETYGANPSNYDKYYFGDTDEYIYFGDLIQNAKASEARQADLEKQMVADVAYILNLEGSAVIQDDNGSTRVMDAADEASWRCVQTNQTIYLNKLTDEWCDYYGFDADAFSYEWHGIKETDKGVNKEFIEKNDGVFKVDGQYGSFEGVVKYGGRKIYSITFTIADVNTFISGDGSKDDPYVICTAEQFNLIKNGLDKHYILVHDLDFTDIAFSPIGSGEENQAFTGSLNGNGYTIKNLKVSAENYAGVFGYIGESGVVKNLNIKNSEIKLEATEAEATVYAGVVAAFNKGKIENCSVVESAVSVDATCNLELTHSRAFAGGVAGHCEGMAGISYCKIIDTAISADFSHDYGYCGDGNGHEHTKGKNSTSTYVAGVVASIAENATVQSCYVSRTCQLSASAISMFDTLWAASGGGQAWYSPLISVRAAGVVALFDDITKISNVWSETDSGVCTYDLVETKDGFFDGAARLNEKNCSAEFNQYITTKGEEQVFSEEQIASIKAPSSDAIDFPIQTLYDTITYSFDGAFNEIYNCYEDQLYVCNEEPIKLDNLNILIDGQKVDDYEVVSYYNFDTFNSDKTAPKTNEVVIVFTTEYEGKDIVERLHLPITITENSAIGLEVAVTPSKTEFEKDEIVSKEDLLSGGYFGLRYQDGSLMDVTSSVDVICDTSTVGVTQVSVSYGEWTTTYDIVISCAHNYSETLVPATCTTYGYTLHTCEYCEHTYKTDYVGKIAHTPFAQNEIAATCTEQGKSADIVCAVCQYVLSLGETVPPTGHDFEGGTADFGSHQCKTCDHTEEHLFRTTENEAEVICTCVICDYKAKYDVNSREKISKLPRIVVSEAYALNGANEVVVYLELYSEVGITGAEFSVYFGDELELVSYEYGNILNKPLASAFEICSDHLNVVLAGAAAQHAHQDFEAPNTLLKLVFRTPNDAVTGDEYPVLVLNKTEVNNGTTVTMDKFTSSTGQPLDFIALNGKIKIVDRLPGDVVGDGSIDLLDAVIIAQYIVKEGEKLVTFLEETQAQYENFDISYGDVTLNNLCEAADLVQILRYIVGGYEARILAKEFIIKFNYNDGTGNESTMAVKYDENGKIELEGVPVAERDGYKFDGWYYGFGEEAGKLEGNYKWNVGVIEQTLYAHYTLNYISFVDTEATAGSMTDISYGDMDQWTVNTAFEKTNTIYFNSNGSETESYSKSVPHNFEGWALAPNGEIAYYPGDIINLKDDEIGNITLYAIWSAPSIVLPDMTRTGYTFGSWASDAAGNNIVGYKGSSYLVKADITLYADWIPISYKVVYNGNGATSGSTATSTHEYDIPKALSTNDFKREYVVTYNFMDGRANDIATATYAFMGWRGEDGMPYDKKEIVENLKNTKDATFTMTAQWQPASVILPNPTRTGYTFAGWYNDSAYTKKVGNAGDSYIPTQNTTLYAKWNPNQYTIAFDSAGGTSVSSVTYTYGDSTKAPPKPTRVGYEFSGWKFYVHNDNGTTGAEISFAFGNKIPAHNVKAVAQWNRIYAFSFEDNRTYYLSKDQDDPSHSYYWYINTRNTFDVDYFIENGYSMKITVTYTAGYIGESGDFGGGYIINYLWISGGWIKRYKPSDKITSTHVVSWDCTTSPSNNEFEVECTSGGTVNWHCTSYNVINLKILVEFVK